MRFQLGAVKSERFQTYEETTRSPPKILRNEHEHEFCFIITNIDWGN